MEWHDQGILVSAKRHGEGSAIIDVFTESHGRQSGVVRGGGSRKVFPLLQPGAQLELRWKARLAEHLGTFNVEHKFSRAGDFLQSRSRLRAFNAWVSLVSGFLPERVPFQGLYTTGYDHLARLRSGKHWKYSHAKWEAQLLTDLGYGLDLGRCVVSGSAQDLWYVSPKSGCAVSAQSAMGWEDKLLKLPQFIIDNMEEDISDRDFYTALLLTGYFLEFRVLADIAGHRQMPSARARMLSYLKKGLRLNSIE